MQTAHIPQALRERIEAAAAPFRLSDLAAAAEAMSRAYRAGLPAALHSPLARAAYAVTRLPATFAALSAAARELPVAPQSWLDLGAGPGASAWLSPCPVTLVEQNPGWQDFSPGRWLQADLCRLPHLDPHDLVTVSYALNELAPRERERLIAEAWLLSRHALLLVEPGTVDGFRIVREARRQLIAAGAHIHAPCPHPGECPLPDGDWCHFAVRVERSRTHRLAKGGDLSYEDEKFSYVLATRQPRPTPPARILRTPLVHPGLIELKLCAPAGLQTERVTRRDKPSWRPARKADWGGAWPAP
ncbi:MAG: methyltransferase type 11 [Acidobacteria bacterium]|nr:methyltransferase type 11 [Acidobacteriota bacterium]